MTGLELALVGIGLSTASAGVSAFQSFQQASFNKKTAEQNAAADEAARRKNRKLDEENLRDRLSAIKARSGGLSFGGSLLDVYEETISRFRTKQEIADVESANRQTRIRNQGKLLHSRGIQQGIATGVGAAGNAFINSSIVFED